MLKIIIFKQTKGISEMLYLMTKNWKTQKKG